MLLSEFDPNREAVLNPWKPDEIPDDIPQVCIGVFSDAIVKEFVRRHNGVVYGWFPSVGGDSPIYRMTLNGLDILFFVPNVGAPAAAGMLEEMIVWGAEYFVFLGCCGVLQNDIVDGHIILPTAALRDEGLSYHYIPAADEIAMPAQSMKAMHMAMETLGLPYVEAKTWTTDALYRETRDKVNRRKGQGCVCVEMECAALLAVAEFRGVSLAQFLWSADNLDAPEWEKRGLDDCGSSGMDKYMAAAVEIAKNMIKLHSIVD